MSIFLSLRYITFCSCFTRHRTCETGTVEKKVASMKRILQLQYTGFSIVSIDEQGRVKMQGNAERSMPNQDMVILEPEEAYNLYQFLSKHIDLLNKFAAPRKEPRIETTLGVANYFSSNAVLVQGDDQQLI